jgi:hypothetical protein
MEHLSPSLLPTPSARGEGEGKGRPVANRRYSRLPVGATCPVSPGFRRLSSDNLRLVAGLENPGDRQTGKSALRLGRGAGFRRLSPDSPTIVVPDNGEAG